MHLLNHRKPEHPPDIYFIRRNQNMLERYLNQREMDGLIKDAQPRAQHAYKLFELNPYEKDIVQTMSQAKRNLMNPSDPFYTKTNKHFHKRVTGLYKTDKVLREISPRDHTKWLSKSKEQIKEWSRNLNHSLCDREHIYYRAMSPEMASSEGTKLQKQL